MQEVIRQVGNYGEVYENNLPPKIQLPREGSLNASWLADPSGLIYAPAWR
jgi:hypothetical protein